MPLAPAPSTAWASPCATVGTTPPPPLALPLWPARPERAGFPEPHRRSGKSSPHTESHPPRPRLQNEALATCVGHRVPTASLWDFAVPAPLVEPRQHLLQKLFAPRCSTGPAAPWPQAVQPFFGYTPFAAHSIRARHQRPTPSPPRANRCHQAAPASRAVPDGGACTTQAIYPLDFQP